jgi:hypothetical protein
MSRDEGTPFDVRLHRALREEASRFRPLTDAGRIERALAARPPIRRRVAALAVLGTAAVVIGTLAVSASSNPPSAAQAPGRTSPGASAPPAEAPIGLADCQIAPADASLAFAGWTMLDLLHVSGGTATPGQPVYAQITRGMVEWVGWDRAKGGMYPRPIGRMGCVYDPSTSLASLVGVPLDWQPPETMDGCPASAEDSFGGYHEIGGPRAWLLVPQEGLTWHVGVDEYRMLFRLSPPAAPGQPITARALPLNGGTPVPAHVEARPQPSAARVTQGQSRYYTLNLRLASRGCWVVNVSVNGAVVGSAIAWTGGSLGPPRAGVGPASTP